MTADQESRKKTDEKGSREDVPASNIVQQLDRWRLKFNRFGWDVLGITLLALSSMILLGLTGLSQGRIMVLGIGWLRLWLGWGAYLMVALLAILGFLALRRRSDVGSNLSFGRIIALETAVFLLVMLFSVLGGHSLQRAESGLDGGQVGWGLVELFARILPIPLIGIFSGAVAFMVLLYLSGIGAWLVNRLETWANRVSAEPAVSPAGFSPLTDADQDVNGAIGAEGAQEGFEEPETQLFPTADRAANLPPLDLLNSEQVSQFSNDNIHDTASQIEQTLSDFGIPARVVGFREGPTVTQFAVEPGYVERPSPEGEMVRHKVRVSQISALSRDLALALSAERLRIEAPVPGQSFVGIEVPNPQSSIVGLRTILESEEFQQLSAPLGIALGKDVSGRAVVADLARMPHLLIAGTTGSGKSVCIAALAVCLLMNNTPEQLKLVMIDPKMVELIRFNGIKHLYGKVETDMERIPIVLRWALAEMDRRYRLLESAHSRNIDTYNSRAGRKKEDMLPRIVIFIDELADLMFSAPDQTEHSLVRLAQMARATGIHLVVATQRPSTDVVTGLIKANFPARISFNVASSIDSRVILDSTGAETLLGKGDMLFLHPEKGKPIRTQGVIIHDSEIERLMAFWEDYEADEHPAPPWEQLVSEAEEEGPDRLVEQAIEIVKGSGRASASMLQRRLRIGYPRAARLIDELEELGVVGPSQGGGREREVISDEVDENEPFQDGEDGYSTDD